jgi:hypothetical protein
MKTLSAVAVGLAIALSAHVAQAYVVQVVTAVPVTAPTTAGDPLQLDDAVQSAIRDVLHRAIAFTPSVVQIEDARIIGNQLYLVLLLADTDGEAMLDRLDTGHVAPADPDTGDDDPADGVAVPRALTL